MRTLRQSSPRRKGVRRPSFDHLPIAEIERGMRPDEGLYLVIERPPVEVVPILRDAATRVGARLIVIGGDIAGFTATDEQVEALRRVFRELQQPGGRVR